MIVRKVAVAALTVFALAAVSSPARAGFERGTYHFELQAGSYMPEGGGAFTYGLRGGAQFSRHVGWDVALSRSAEGESTVLFLDAPLQVHLTPARKATFVIGAGPGWTRFESEAFDDTISVDTLTFNVEAGGKFLIGDSFYLHPGARLRWYEKASDDSTDWEATLGFGWAFGM